MPRPQSDVASDACWYRFPRQASVPPGQSTRRPTWAVRRFRNTCCSGPGVGVGVVLTNGQRRYLDDGKIITGAPRVITHTGHAWCLAGSNGSGFKTANHPGNKGPGRCGVQAPWHGAPSRRPSLRELRGSAPFRSKNGQSLGVVSGPAGLLESKPRG